MRPTFAEIDLSAIAYNISSIKNKVSPAQLMVATKADAYGHGAMEVTKTVLDNGADWLGVALVEEGIELRESGIDAPILVFGGIFIDQIEFFLKYDLHATVYELEHAIALAKLASQCNKIAKVHVKVDTGMGRAGIRHNEAMDFLEKIRALDGLEIVGLYTHFATSDWLNKDFALLQLKRFKQVVAEVQAAGIEIPLLHAANSGAIMDLPDTYFDMVRAGVSAYGYYPSSETSESVKLKPAMALKSKVLAVKNLAEGDFVSYNLTYKAKSATQIAILPIGYGDGYDRQLSNQSEVLICGNRYPVVGTVCMDQVMVDLGLDSSIKIGDEVVLLGRQGADEITIYEYCSKLKTIPYEVTCGFSKRVPRVYIS